jgi:hypothetical protein
MNSYYSSDNSIRTKFIIIFKTLLHYNIRNIAKKVYKALIQPSARKKQMAFNFLQKLSISHYF